MKQYGYKDDYSKIKAHANPQNEKFYDPFLEHIDPATLDLSSCPNFQPTRVEQEDGFHVPLVKEYELSKKDRAKVIQNRLENDPTYLDDLRKIPAYGSGYQVTRTQEEEHLLSELDAAENLKKFQFGIDGYKVYASWERNRWVCEAYNNGVAYESGKFIPCYSDGTPVEHSDKESVMLICNKHYIPKALWRQLTPNEQRSVSYIASGGTPTHIQHAADVYFGYAVDEYSEDERAEKWVDPRFIQLLEEANWFAFIEGKVGLTDSGKDSDVDRIMEILGNRTATVDSLIACYEIFEKKQAKGARSRLFAPTEPEPEPKDISYADLDKLSNKEIKQLRTQTLLAASR